MSKINTTTLMRRKRRYETRSFTDPDVPGEVLTLTLCPQDVLIGAQAQDLAEELWEEYGPDKDGDKKPFEIFTDPEDTEPTFLSKTFVTLTAAICVSQGGEPKEKYSPDDLIAIALAMPTAWTSACEWAGELSQRSKTEGNRSGAGEASSSAPVSTNISSIPLPSSGKPNSDASNTSNSEPLQPTSGLMT